jgi:hypothetical protein
MDAKPYPAEKARGGEIILRTPARRAIFSRRADWRCRACRHFVDSSLSCSPKASQSRANFESAGPERSFGTDVCPHIFRMEKQMSKFGILGATALSLSLAVATPALAQHVRGGGGGVHAAGGMHVGGGNFGGMRTGGPGAVGGQANFRGAQANQANIGTANVAARNGNFTGRGSVVAQGGYRDGAFRRDGVRGWGPGAGFVAGLAAGSALGYGASYDGYYDPYYGDSYAYYGGDYNDPGYPVVVEQNVTGDASYCAQRFQSYDPASGTYLGFDGLRHPCP